MDKEGKFWISFWVSAFTFILLIIAIMCYMGIARGPLTLQEKRLATHERIMCINARGTWASTDNDNRPPYSCKFK